MPAWAGGRRRRSGAGQALLALVAAGLVLGVIYALGPAELPDAPAEVRGVPRIVDGDTLALEGFRVRIAGIDAPELAQSCGRAGETWACGVAARDHLHEIAGEAITCQPVDRDRWGRIVAVCRAGAVDLGARMVGAGWAVAVDRYRADELAARVAARGIWSGPFDHPAEWRRQTAGLEQGLSQPSRFEAFLEWLGNRLRR